MDPFVKFNPDSVDWSKLLAGREPVKIQAPETSPSLKTESTEKPEKKVKKRAKKQEGAGKKTRRIKREKLLPFSLFSPNSKRLHLLSKNGKTGKRVADGPAGSSRT